ncbi:MAG: C40 family peptidase [Bacteroidales bacterium]|nr:C40 family peptidase [Bacteroidales bacterium]
MRYGFCHIAIAPLRKENSERSEMISQLIFGDCFKILEQIEDKILIENFDDQYVGWVDQKQTTEISQADYNAYTSTSKQIVTLDQTYISQTNQKTKQRIIYPIYLGSQLIGEKFQLGDILFQILEPKSINKPKTNILSLITIALKYVSAPYLWGGKSLYGIDCSGLTQMCYKQIGVNILRDAKDQITQGEDVLSIEEAEKGDLCFFHNQEGKITHVGIYIGSNLIIHASGQVRIDTIDQKGILPQHSSTYTHHLNKIKRYL